MDKHINYSTAEQSSFIYIYIYTTTATTTTTTVLHQGCFFQFFFYYRFLSNFIQVLSEKSCKNKLWVEVDQIWCAQW